MSLKLLVPMIFLIMPSLSFGGSKVTKVIEVAQNATETVIIETEVPVSFNAQFVNLDYLESKKCGNCLHIETIANGSKNWAASNYGVGFISVPPENGRISVDVFHDYGTTKEVEIVAETVKSR